MSSAKYTGNVPWRSLFGIGLAGGLLAGLLTFGSHAFVSPPKAEAQFAGQGTFNFNYAVHFPSTAYQYVPIDNHGQLSEMVSYTWTGACTPSSGSSTTFALEGSNDKITWFDLSSSTEVDAAAGSAILYSNGYFNFKRLSFPPCTSSITIGGEYTGYSVPLPLNFTSPDLNFFSLTSAVAFGPSGYFLVQAFQCSDSALQTAFIVFQGLPSGQAVFRMLPNGTFNYIGPGFLANGSSTVGAFTSSTPTTPVSTAIPCTFELTGGPFYPLSPQVTN